MCIVEGDMVGMCKNSICVDVSQGKPIGNMPQRTGFMPLPPRLPELGGKRPSVLPIGPSQQGPQILPTGPTQQRPQVQPTGPTQQQPAVQPAKPACPSTPMCRSAASPCQQAPPCDANGRPVSKCWVNKPAGAACMQGGRAGMCSSAGQCTV
jgi:hypothetical protein